VYSISFPGKLFWKKKIFAEVNLMLDIFIFCFSKRRGLTTQSNPPPPTSAPEVVQRRETQTCPADKWEHHLKIKDGEIDSLES